MKKSALKEAIKGEITSILSENEMTTAEAFRALRDIHSNLPKWGGPEGKHYTELMGQALDVLQRGEITKMMDRERGLNEIQFMPNTGLSQIKDQGEIDGKDAITKELRQYGFKNVVDIETYVEAFGDGVGEEAGKQFNADLSRWDVSNVTDMQAIFFHAESFNCNLSSWNVEKVKNMMSMFSGAKKFDNNTIKGWRLKGKETSYMFGKLNDSALGRRERRKKEIFKP